MIQLSLFPETPEEKQERINNSLLAKCEKIRKSQHARISALQKKVDDLESQVRFLESFICKENLFCSH